MDVNISSTAESTADVDLICSLSKLLNTGRCYSFLAYGCQCNLSTNAGLDRRAIVIIKELLQLGVQPESLVDGAVHDPWHALCIVICVATALTLT